MEQFLAFLVKNPFHLVLFGIAVVTGGMLIWPLVSRLARPGRDVGEYASGHIANARHIPAAQLAERLKELEKFKSRPIIVVCRADTRAARVAATLRKHGFGEVFTLRGGIAAWQQAGMPLEK